MLNSLLTFRYLSLLFSHVILTSLHHRRELDELEREDFTRLKMVKKKKEEQIKLDEAAKLKRVQADLAAATLREDQEESGSETTEGRDENGVLLRPKHPKITQYQSKRRDSTPGGVVRSPTKAGSATTSSARQPGMEDLEEDNDVVFK